MNKLNISTFFPEDMLQIAEVNQKEKATHIYLKSETKSCNCPKCGQLTEQYYGTYVGTVQDSGLGILIEEGAYKVIADTGEEILMAESTSEAVR